MLLILVLTFAFPGNGDHLTKVKDYNLAFYMCVQAHRNQKRALDFLKLELQLQWLWDVHVGMEKHTHCPLKEQ